MSELYGKPYLTLKEIEERIEELEDERDEFVEEYLEGRGPDYEDQAEEAWEDTDEAEELEELSDIQKELDKYVDRSENLIHEDEFLNYAMDLANDIHGAQDAQWPFNHVDWEAAAEALRGDFSEVEIGGDTYYYRG